MSDAYSGVTPSQTYHLPPPQYHHHPTQYQHYPYTTAAPQALHVQQQQPPPQPQQPPQPQAHHHQPAPPPTIYRNDSGQSVASSSQPHVHLQQSSAAPALTGEGGGAGPAGRGVPGPRNTEIVASRTGDWTASLVRMAKEAELKKHALSLQLQTTKIMSYNTTLQKKVKSLNDYKKQRERLEAQRNQLLNQLREVNENREKVDLEESKAQKECDEVRRKVQDLKDGDYSIAKSAVDKLRQELGLEEIKSIDDQLDEKNGSKRKPSGAGDAGHMPQADTVASTSQPAPQPSPQTEPSPSLKRAAPPAASNPTSESAPPVKRPRGRPKGSKNKPKDDKQEPGMNGASTIIQT